MYHHLGDFLMYVFDIMVYSHYDSSNTNASISVFKFYHLSKSHVCAVSEQLWFGPICWLIKLSTDIRNIYSMTFVMAPKHLHLNTPSELQRKKTILLTEP